MVYSLSCFIMKQMRFVKQHDENDCGAACLSMIASSFGYHASLGFFRSTTKTDSVGCSIYDICQAANQIGLDTNALCGDISELKAIIDNKGITLPIIAHIVTEEGFSHFIVIKDMKKDYLLVLNPAYDSVQKVALSEFKTMWSGEIIAFSRNETFNKTKDAHPIASLFKRLLLSNKQLVIAVLFISLFIALIEVAGTFIFQISIDSFFYNYGEEIDEDLVMLTETWFDRLQVWYYSNPQNHHIAFGMLLGLNVVAIIFALFRGKIIAKLSNKLDSSIILPYFNRIINLPIANIQTRQIGDYLSRYSDAGYVRDAIVGAFISILLDATVVILSGIILFLENKILFAVSTIMVILYLFLGIFFRKPLSKMNNEIMKEKAGCESYFKEVVDGVSTIKMNTAEHYVESRFKNRFSLYLNKLYKGNIVFNAQNVCTIAVDLIGTLVILWIGFSFVQSYHISIGSLMTFYALMGYFTSPFKNLVTLQPELRKAVAAGQRLYDIMESDTEKETGIIVEDISEIVFKDVCFQYKNGLPLLTNINFDIKKGEKCALVGKSGCGKTSIAKLIMSFYKANCGEVIVGDKNICEYSLNELRSKIAYIEQEPFFFSDTIKNNLILGNNDISDDQILSACKTSGILEFIISLPQGIESRIDESGRNLSGGQKKRLSIARALLKNAEIYIIDELTANIDAKTADEIENNLSIALKDKTCIYISHDTNKNFDQVLYLNDGYITAVNSTKP